MKKIGYPDYEKHLKLHEIFRMETLLVFSFFYLAEKRLRHKWIYYILVFPTTFLHELSHFLIAFITGGKPFLPSLIPKRRRGAVIMGEVKFYATPLSAFPSALAPLLLIPLAFYFLSSSIPFPLKETLSYYALRGSLPSLQDIKVAFSHPFGALLWILLLFFSAGFLYEIVSVRTPGLHLFRR